MSTGPKQPPSESMLTAIAELFHLIQSQKKKTGAIQPKDFIITLKRENGEQFTPNSQRHSSHL